MKQLSPRTTHRPTLPVNGKQYFTFNNLNIQSSLFLSLNAVLMEEFRVDSLIHMISQPQHEFGQVTCSASKSILLPPPHAYGGTLCVKIS